MTHTELTPELITAIVGTITGAIGAYVALRRFGPEERKNTADTSYVKAQENKVEADTAISWVETYEKMYGIILERDADILSLKKSYEDLRSEFSKYKIEAKLLLDAEKKARKLAENERDDLKDRVRILEVSLSEQGETIKSLSEKIDSLSPKES